MGSVASINVSRVVQSGTAEVTMAARSGTLAVEFDPVFASAPFVAVVPHAADTGATYAADSVTTDGFTLDVSGSAYNAGAIKVRWYAFEKD